MYICNLAHSSNVAWFILDRNTPGAKKRDILRAFVGIADNDRNSEQLTGKTFKYPAYGNNERRCYKT